MSGNAVEARERTDGSDGRSASAPDGTVPGSGSARPSFLRRHRLPLALALIALCLYVGSIVYILFGRGQIA